MIYDCIIIGGGASGLMLAAKLNLNGRSGLILEGTPRIGSKLLMTGGGRCNITHAGSIKNFLPEYGPAARFLRKCLYRHNNEDFIGWLDDCLGISVKTDEVGRVFPVSEKAADVRKALADKAAANGWEIKTSCKVVSIDEEIRCRNENGEALGFRAANIVIASGGITYPETGSDGSIIDILAADLSIEITGPRSALAPLVIRNYPYAELAGVSLQDVRVRLERSAQDTSPADGKRPADEASGVRSAVKLSNKEFGKLAVTGDVLFTHDGLSGPAILNISRYAELGMAVCLSYGKQIEELPHRMRKLLEDRCRGPRGDIRTKQLAALLAEDRLTVSAIGERGMITDGGIALHQLNPSTMELTVPSVTSADNASAAAASTGDNRPRFFAIGEAIDACGSTGGYNLQICYSTASAAADELQAALQTTPE